MPRPQFKLRSLLLAAGVVAYLLVAAPYWFGLARIQYREYRIRAVRKQLSPAHRAQLNSELKAWLLDRSIHPESGE